MSGQPSTNCEGARNRALEHSTLPDQFLQPHSDNPCHAQRACHPRVSSSASNIHLAVLKPFNPTFTPWPVSTRELEGLHLKYSKLLGRPSSRPLSQTNSRDLHSNSWQAKSPEGQNTDIPHSSLVSSTSNFCKYQKNHSSCQEQFSSTTPKKNTLSMQFSASAATIASRNTLADGIVRVQVTSSNFTSHDFAQPSPWTAQSRKAPTSEPGTPAEILDCMLVARSSHRGTAVETTRAYRPPTPSKCKNPAAGRNPYWVEQQGAMAAACHTVSHTTSLNQPNRGRHDAVEPNSRCEPPTADNVEIEQHTATGVCRQGARVSHASPEAKMANAADTGMAPFGSLGENAFSSVAGLQLGSSALPEGCKCIPGPQHI
jgi:hypothetical protein